MKSFPVVLALILSGCSAAQNAGNLVDRFSNEKNVETVNMGDLTMNFIESHAKAPKGVESFQVLDLGECTADVKQRFADEVTKLKKGGYELLMESKENGEHTQILLKKKQDEIHELLIITTGSSPAMVRFAGKIKQSDIQGLIDKH